MTATSIRTNDRITSSQWFERLLQMERPSADGYEITVVRADRDIQVVEIEIATDHAEVLAIFPHICAAYTYARAALINHPETGFYVV